MRNFTRLMCAFTIVAFLLLGANAHAQNTTIVQTQGNTFVPSQVTISVGDTVRWFNTGGSHSVNGSIADNPGNPESFGTGIGSGWVYAHKFTIPGTYNYFCDPHVSFGMTGVVIVEDVTTGLDESDDGLVKHIFPMPASEFVVLQLDEQLVQSYPNLRLKVYSLDGREQIVEPIVLGSMQKVDVRNLPSGLNIFQLLHENDVLHTGKIVIQ